MRIRIYRAFASNNSGSYTIVGRFESAKLADQFADNIEEVCIAHHDWLGEEHGEQPGESPLDAFRRKHGLRPDESGHSDNDWPEYGPRPTAIAIDRELVVHAPYTISVPPVFGEFIYAKGGRVSTELDHAHADIAVTLHYWVAGSSHGDLEVEARLDAFQTKLAEALPAWTAHDDDRVPVVEPAWNVGGWGARAVSVVLPDFCRGILGVRTLARECGVNVHTKIWECPHDVADPLALHRAPPAPAEPRRIILWRIGSDPTRALRAIREVLGTTLDDAKLVLADLPREICVGVTESDAAKAVAILTEARCEAEAVTPARRR